MTRNIVEGAFYSSADVEFYRRAIVNYPDRNEAREAPTSGAGIVTITTKDGKVKTKKPYSPKDLASIIQQGSQRPRPLTHDELERSRAGRRAARGDLQAMEQWHRSEARESTKGRRLQRARGGPEDKTLNGIELGDTFWNPVEW